MESKLLIRSRHRVVVLPAPGSKLRLALGEAQAREIILAFALEEQPRAAAALAGRAWRHTCAYHRPLAAGAGGSKNRTWPFSILFEAFAVMGLAVEWGRIEQQVFDELYIPLESRHHDHELPVTNAAAADVGL